MIDDAFILKVERLRDSVDNLKGLTRRTYGHANDRVRATIITEEARRLAEIWMVEIAPRDEVRTGIPAEVLADYNIGFQRLLTLSDRQSQRQQYDQAFRTILRDFRARVVVPLKQFRGATASSAVSQPPAPKSLRTSDSVFVAHSFDPDDARVVDAVKRFFEIRGLKVITGERPKADLVSTKIRGRIEEADVFVGVFSRRDKISGRNEWTTSAWLIDEKAFALANGKKLILLKEDGVGTIGGLQGDYEYLEFTPEDLHLLILSLMELVDSD